MIDREKIYQAFFGLVQKLNPIVPEIGDGGLLQPVGDGTWAAPASRRFKPWTQCQLQPCAFLMETGEDAVYQVYNGPRKTTLICQLVVYSNAGKDPNAVPGTALNNLIEAIEQAVRPGEHEETLGGLVHWVRFSARTTLYEGANADQAITLVGYEILATR